MFKNILFFISILFLEACSIDEVNISGTITNAEDGQWIFLEKLTLLSPLISAVWLLYQSKYPLSSYSLL